MIMNKGAITRLVIMMLALGNQILTMSGKHIIDIDDKTIEIFISSIFSIVSGFIAWYYNNPTSKINEKHTELMREEKFEKEMGF